MKIESLAEENRGSPKVVEMKRLEIAEMGPNSKDPNSDEDDVWIGQTLAGNQDTFGRLIEKYKDQLFDLAFRMVRNRSDAEDVLQDSFLAAYRHLSGFNHQSRFSTWIYTIVLNRARNLLRHNRVLRWSSLDMPTENYDGDKPVEIPEKAPPHDVLIDRKLEIEAIEREVGALPIHYQSFFILHYFQNMPLEEIAKKLNRPIGTVKAYLHRARKVLYKRLVPKSLVDSDLHNAPPMAAAPQYCVERRSFSASRVIS